jgi:hypothetical protein
MAIFMGRASYAHSRDSAQMSARGWAGMANMAGIPYDTLFLEDIAVQDLARYRLLVFAQITCVEEKTLAALAGSLEKYLAGGGNVIVDGPLATSDEAGKERDHAALDALLGIAYGGAQGDSNYRIKAPANGHYVTRAFEAGQFLSQPLARGLKILSFKEGGEVLLISTDGKRTYPFLSCRSTDKNRVVLFSDLTTSAGATSFFRNYQPEGFYANQVLNAAVRAVDWAAYGDAPGPFPAPQVTDANMTAIGRLDGDTSENYKYTADAFRYWIKVAKQSGVVPIYAFVSDLAAKAGWDKLAPLAKELEALGGEIGSHSKTHGDYFDTQKISDADWHSELDGSIEAITSNLEKNGAPIGKLDMFINPGNSILMEYYGQIARRFALMMTHGLETDTPIAFGNLTWFTGPDKNLVVLDNVPAPDWAWFYMPDWSYSTGSIVANQETIIDHMFHNIGRGAIFSLMWHDYSITEPPMVMRRKTTRITNTINMPLYQAVADKWATLPIYCPEPEDLANKVRAMAQWDYSWKSEGNRIEMDLDLAPLRLPETAEYTGGMGIRIENTGEQIQSVSINGQPHFAFAGRLVILPNLRKGVNRIAVTLGPEEPPAAHVTYVSKRMPTIQKTGENLEFRLLTKSKARFSLSTAQPAVLLNADWQEWDRKLDHQLNGYVTSDRTLVLAKAKRTGFALTRATLPVTAFQETASGISLTLGSAVDGASALWFRATKPPKTITLAGRALRSAKVGLDYEVPLPEVQAKSELRIEF